METGSGSVDILLVDDMPANLKVLADMLRAEGYGTRSAINGEAALKAADLCAPDLVLLDVMMPDINGFEVCRRLKSSPRLAEVPVIFLSALDETEGKVEAFAAGGVDYITKPFQVDEVRARVRTHLRVYRLQRQVEAYSHELEALVRDQIEEIRDAQMATIVALARLAESRDDETGTHLERVQSFCRMLALGLARVGVDECMDRRYIDDLVLASQLHDIGKVAISDSILLKPGKLTAEEFESMKTHTLVGSETLEAVRRQYPGNRFVLMGLDIVRSHHERWDGGGYPDGLEGTRIPLSARIMAVADVYDALRSRRIYKPPVSHDESCRIIMEGSGAHFDPDVVRVFAGLHDEFNRIFGSPNAVETQKSSAI